MEARLSARELIDLVLDAGSYESWDAPAATLAGTPPGTPAASRDSRYAAALATARRHTGLDESVTSGSGTIRGRRVAVVACEFGFLAGSIGVAAAERLVTAVERATAERMPLLAAPASGGTRMQEGTVAFLQMVKISAAIAAHKAAGLPYLVYLRHPTTGGVFASWGSLGHVTVAEPGALIGFLGPRVHRELYGEEFPPGVQTAEHLLEHGIVDAVLAPDAIPEIADRALTVLCGRPANAVVPPSPEADPVERTPAWESVVRSRDMHRPGVRTLLRVAADDTVPLNGTGEGEAEPGLLLALVRFGPEPCVLLGQDRRGQARHGLLGPGALREARRGMRLAAELRLPLVTVIDTPGVALSRRAEEGGIAAEIARCLTELVTLSAPTLCLLLGQGTGGGALALLPADRVVAAQHAWLAPLPPEGASAILHGTRDYAADIAQMQRIRAVDLHRDGIVDRVVAERPDAAEEAEAFCRRVGTVLGYELAVLGRYPDAPRYAARLARYRRLGEAGAGDLADS